MKAYAAAALVAAALAAGCGAAGSDDDSGGSSTTSAATQDFWAGFEPPAADAPSGGKVDTTRYKKPNGKQLVIGYADASLSNSWRVMAKAETEYAADKAGVKLVYTNADDSTPKQISNMEDLVSRRVDAIVLAATDVNALCPAIDKALAAGIPVVIQERKVNCDRYTTWVSENSREVSAYQMEYVAQRLGGKGKIAILSGIAGSGASVEAEEVYADVLAKYPDIEVVATQYGEYDPAKSRQIAEAWLTANPDLEAIASISGNMTIGVFEAAKQLGRVESLKAWTGDDANGWMKIAAENALPSMTTPLPPKAGRDSIDVTVKILRGEPVNRIEYVEKWADPVEFSRNIDKYANEDRSDEWWYTDLPCDADPFCKA